jgi:hypothetical protein
MITLPITWLNGISAFAIFCSAWIFTIMSIIYYKKTKSHTFLTCLLLGIAVGLGWTGIFSSFLSNLLKGDNIELVLLFPRYLTFGVIPLGALAIIYTTWDIAGSPKNKKTILLGFGLFTLLYYVIYYVGTPITSAVKIIPGFGTDTLYDDWLDPSYLFYWMLWAEVVIAAIVSGVGFMKFLKVTTGALRKKAMYLLIATFFVGIGILEDLVDFTEFHLFYLWIARFLVVPGMWLIFFGFKPIK